MRRAIGLILFPSTSRGSSQQVAVSARGFLDRTPGLSDGRGSMRLALLSATVVSLLWVGITLQSLGTMG